MTTTYRIANKSDNKNILALARKGCWSLTQVVEAFCVEAIKQQNPNWNKFDDLAWVAEKDGKIIGFLVSSFPNSNHPKIATAKQNQTLELLYVDKKYRKAGIGSKLVEVFFTTSQAEGRISTQVQFDRTDKKLQKYWKKMGFAKNPAEVEDYSIPYTNWFKGGRPDPVSGELA